MNIMATLADIRKEYTRSTLEVDKVTTRPIPQFEKWFDEAVKAGVPEPTAMTLSTVSAAGRPSSRVVLLKGISEGAFLFYTNYQSNKGKALEANEHVALNFFWPELERQVRIEGVAGRVSAATSDDYFHSRPRASQIGAWASPQSTVIANRDILEARVKALENKFAAQDEIPRPQQWGGYAVDPVYVEFWQGRPSRLHDRIVYVLGEKGWTIHRLAP